MTSKILVVEDEAVIAADIRMSLTELGYRVVGTAASGATALAAVQKERPDLVLMDIHVQGEIDGVEAALRIRETLPTPVIFLTSFSDDATIERAKYAGAYGYLLKPFSTRDLKVAIDVALTKCELEERLAEREHWFSTTLRSIGDAVIATDPEQRITFMNLIAEQTTGWTMEEARGRALHEVFHLVDEATGAPVTGPLGRALHGGFAIEVPQRVALQSRDGEKRSVDDSAAPIVTEKGRILGGVVVFRDITERRQLEQRLAQAERLAAIGTLSAGMAHEINNPLAYVLANVDYALDSLPRLRAQIARLGDSAAASALDELDEVFEALGEAKDGSHRVHRIVHDLKKFGRVDPIEGTLVELTDVIETAVRMTENVVRHHARIRREYGTTPFVAGDHGQLGQIFINLLVNAAQALGDGDAHTKQIVLVTRTDDRGYAVAEVRDNGPGIPPEVIAKLFDPFFTTKAVGVGVGLGLSICHSIARAHGGELTVQSEPGAGATFRLTLPAASRDDIAKTTGTSPPIAPSRRGRVLVIDDEPGIGRAVSRVLKRDHEVFFVSDPRDVLPRLGAGETFDVVFCDLMMPGMTGIDFHAALFELNPALAARIVFMTGGAFTPRAEEFLRTTPNATLSKPAEPDAIRRIVADYVSRVPRT